jgi:hypothetical protein
MKYNEYFIKWHEHSHIKTEIRDGKEVLIEYNGSFGEDFVRATTGEAAIEYLKKTYPDKKNIEILSITNLF